MNDYYESSPINFAYYWQILKVVFRKNIKRSLLMAFLIGSLTFMYSLSLEPEYRATTVMHVAPQKDAVFNLRELFLNRKDPAFRQTQVGIIRSRNLVGKVVDRLELDKHPVFLSGDVSAFAKIKEKLGLSLNETIPRNVRRTITSDLVSKLLNT